MHHWKLSIIFKLSTVRPMSKKIFYLLLVLACQVPAYSLHAQRRLLSADAGFPQVKEDLQNIGSWRDALRKEIKADIRQLPDEVRQSLVKNGEHYLDYSWPALQASKYLEFVETGNRNHYESDLSQRRRALSALVIAELVENKGRFLPQILNGLWATCEESTWCLPAHLGFQKKGVGLPDPQEQVIDLGVGMTTALLSWTSFLLGQQLDSLHPMIPVKLQYAFETRVMQPYLQRTDFWWMGLQGQGVNNWNPWVNHNVLTTALLTEPDPARMDSVVSKTMQSVDHFIDQYPDDGGCDEGPSYWSRAGGELIAYLSLLKSASAGRIDISSHPLIRNMGSYIYKLNIHDDEFVNFADAHRTTTPEIASVYRFGDVCNDDTLRQFAAFFAKKQGDAADYFLKEAGDLNAFIDYLQVYPGIQRTTPHAPLLKSAWLPDLQVLSARTQAGTAEGLFLGAKGGTNGESHNHNDVGNFIIYSNGEPAIIDLGVGTYTRETFSKDRYKIFTMQSAWHNLPLINGVMQKEGGRFKASNVHFSEDKTGTHLSMDIAGAYPAGAAVRSWVRSLDFRNGKQIVLQEKYALEKYSEPFRLSLITALTGVEVKGGLITLSDAQHHGLVIRYDPRDFDVQVESKKLDDPSLSHAWGNEVKRIWLTDKRHHTSGSYTLRFEALQPW